MLERWLLERGWPGMHAQLLGASGLGLSLTSWLLFWEQ